MTHKISFKLFLISLIFFLFEGQALATYKHKIVVTEFENPQNWNKSYNPGKLLSDNLKRQLIDSNLFHMIPHKMESSMGMESSPKSMKMKSEKHMNRSNSMQNPFIKKQSLNMGNPKVSSEIYGDYPINKPSFKNPNVSPASSEYQMDIAPAIHHLDKGFNGNLITIQDSSDGLMGKMRKMDSKDSVMQDPIPWPIRLGTPSKQATLFKIRGKVIKFNPGSSKSVAVDKEMKLIAENAELAVNLQLIQNKTGRVVYEENFRAYSNSGRRPFSIENQLKPEKDKFKESSSMDLALSFLIPQMTAFVKDKILLNPLEGEIIAVNNEDVLLNIGKQNGVEVGDRFRVFSMSLGLNDPFTANDLGDIYVKMGVIQIMESMLGHSKAVTIIGKDFMPGNLIRSFKSFGISKQQSRGGSNLSARQEQIPWWDFNGIKSVP